MNVLESQLNKGLDQEVLKDFFSVFKKGTAFGLEGIVDWKFDSVISNMQTDTNKSESANIAKQVKKRGTKRG